MTAPPRVSVVVATRNAAAELPGCLASVREQTYPNLEIWVADGASTDGTQAVLAAAGPAVRWFSEPDAGIADAWNKALARVTGEWVIFLGADDRFAAPDVVAHLVAVAAAGAVPDVVSGRAEYVAAGGRVVFTRGAAAPWWRFRLGMVITHPGALHRRSLWAELGPFDPSFRIAADYEFLLRRGPRLDVRFTPRVTTRAGLGGVSTRDYAAARREARRAQLLHRALPAPLAHAHYAFGVLRESLVNRWRGLRYTGATRR